MKNIFKILSLSLLAAVAISCSDSELLIDQVFETVDSETGAVLRTVVAPQDLVSATNPDNNFIDLTVEVQQGNGSFIPDIKELRAYVKLYGDQDLTIPVVDDTGAETPETLVFTFLPEDFEIGPNNLPRKRIMLPTEEVTNAFPTAVIPIPSFIALRFELELADGSIYTNQDLGASVTGGTYFDSRFLYKIIFLNI